MDQPMNAVPNGGWWKKAEQMTVKFLEHLVRTGVLNTGIADHVILKAIYNSKFRTYEMFEVQYCHAFNVIVKKGCVYPRNLNSPSVVTFKMDRVYSILQEHLADSFQNLSISDDDDVSSHTVVSLKVSKRTVPAKIWIPGSKPSEITSPKSATSSSKTQISMTTISPINELDLKPTIKTESVQMHIPPTSDNSEPVKKLFYEAPKRLVENVPTVSLPAENFVDQQNTFKLNEKIVKKQVIEVIDDKPNCQICGEKFENDDKLMDHKETDEHMFREVYQNCKKGYSGTKPPRAVSGEPDGIFVQSKEGGEGRAVLNVNLHLSELDELLHRPVTTTITLVVEYHPTDKFAKPLYLDHTFFIIGGSGVKLKEENAARQTIRKGKKIARNVVITENQVGTTDYIVVFKFISENDKFQTDKLFFVMKKICVRVDNDLTKEDINSTKSSLPRIKRVPQPPSTENQDFITTVPVIVERAEPPPKQKQRLTFVRKLEEYELPKVYSRFFNFGFVNEDTSTSEVLHEKLNVLSILAEGMNEENYNSFLSLMLYLEEHQVLCDLRSYRMINTPLFRDKYNSKLITIEVPGLAEDRPSVLKRDAIYITVPGTGVFLGYVHEVGQTTVHVGMGFRFMKMFVDNMKVTVHFSFNRTCLKMQHRAIDLLKSKKQVPVVCFPKIYGKHVKDRPIRSWINKLIEQNPQQRQAVQNIINGTSLPAPYLLFGPPGTGKTVTLVEAIKQIYFQSESTYILATAPSNSASDLLASRLLKTIPASQVMRLYSPSREWNTVPEDLKICCNYEMRECNFPSCNELMKYRVIVATLICAGRLVSGGIPESHFTHIFVDECGHGMEPQSLVPVAGLLGKHPKPGQLVLSGDPKQLGPIIRSPVAKQLGFAQSLLERLMTSCDIYQKTSDGYNSEVITKLVKNFRSHPDILKVPNELFYDGDLEPCGDVGVIYSACGWSELPTQGVPLIFHGVQGKDAQDDCSPSFYNIAEVDIVVKYVQKILQSKFSGQRLSPADIGIISPYRRQITKLRRAMERKRLEGSTIGSVEEFQGQERRVIIVSTVRSDPTQLSLDCKFRLGFLREPKRFNVALTRAKSLLIVVGNPYILQTDVNWHRLLEWCIQRGGYTGCNFTLSPAPSISSDREKNIVPLQHKLQVQLEHTQQKLQSLEREKDIDTLVQQMNQLNLLAIPKVSDLENIVSPPFSAMEQ